jgi:hypothetical protein
MPETDAEAARRILDAHYDHRPIPSDNPELNSMLTYWTLLSAYGERDDAYLSAMDLTGWDLVHIVPVPERVGDVATTGTLTVWHRRGSLKT